MKAQQFITRMAARSGEAVAPKGEFRLPIGIILRRPPADIFGEFEPLLRLQAIHRVFDFRQAHHGGIYELLARKQGASSLFLAACAPELRWNTPLIQKPSHQFESAV